MTKEGHWPAQKTKEKRPRMGTDLSLTTDASFPKGEQLWLAGEVVWEVGALCTILQAHKAAAYEHMVSKKHVAQVGQDRIFTPYMTVHLAIPLPKILYIHRIYMVLAKPTCG